MYCTYCGFNNAPESKFCESCGRRLDVVPPSPAPPVGTQVYAPSAPHTPMENPLLVVREEWLFIVEWVLANAFAIILWGLLLYLAMLAVAQYIYDRIGGQIGLLTYPSELALRVLLGQIDPKGLYTQLIIAGILASLLAVGLYGALVGGFQWLVIRRRLRDGPWISRTVLAIFAAILVASMLVGLLSNAASGWAVVWLVVGVGLTAGMIQWLVLRSRVSNAWAWPLISTVGLLVATLFVYLFRDASPAIGLILAVLVANALTGVTMAWLVRQPA